MTWYGNGYGTRTGTSSGTGTSFGTGTGTGSGTGTRTGSETQTGTDPVSFGHDDVSRFRFWSNLVTVNGPPTGPGLGPVAWLL